MPFGTLLRFTGFTVLPRLVGRNADVNDGVTVRRLPDFRIFPQRADDDGLVDAPAHVFAPCNEFEC